MQFNGRCDRCREKTDTFTMSIFNTQNICMACKDKEVNHPKYEEAREAEHQAVLRGERNFPGIGLPDDLK